ncbi:hypothetical protein EMN47_07425 [Prolixibacteraceae bacterium JC049]|nr:hypothetical protein [Prolixibacteraceae bacterium JC049]
MSNIQQQTFKGSITSYIGLVIAYVYMVKILPDIVSEDKIGLIRVLAASSAVFSEFATMGFNSVTTRLFPYFRDEKTKHHGFLLMALLFGAIGFGLFILGYGVFKPFIIDFYSEKSALFADYIYLLLPLICFRMLFSLMDVYLSRGCYDSVTGTVWVDFGFKTINFAFIILLWTGIFDFHAYIHAYALALSFPAIPVFIKIIRKNQFPLRFDFKHLTPKLRKEIITISFYGILAGQGAVLVTNLDILMLNSILGLKATGIYGVCAIFATIIKIPFNSLVKATSPVLAEAWKEEDTNKIQQLYYKTSINQLILGILLLIGIWGNIDNIFRILPESYIEGKWVVILVSVGMLFTTSTGASIQVISTSKKYKVLTYLTVGLLLLTVITNLIFIPIWGINGAAIATMATYIINASIRVIYIRVRMGLSPYRWQHLATLLIAAIAVVPTFFIPFMNNIFIDIPIRSAIITLIFTTGVISLNLSEDISRVFKQTLTKLKLIC